jgi:1,4-alpha-glucan branching enzyme
MVGIFLITACSSDPTKTELSESTPAYAETPSEVKQPASSQTETLPPTSTEILATQTPTPIPYTTPDWFSEAVIYEVFVRSFRDTDDDGIGDLAGVTASLDYIQSLGANTIWLMPVYPSPSQHGYGVVDFFNINPDYGDLADLQTVVDEAHAREMRVILDFIPSHLSNQNPIFADAYSDPSSDYSDWFVWNNENHTLYATFAGNEQMPRFNHFNP